MELKAYLWVLLRKWWILLPAFLITFTTTIVLTFTQAPTYEATATFVIAPSSSFENMSGFVNGLEILSRRAEIASTYAEVAASRLIRQDAADELNLSKDQRKELSVDSQLVGGTNVLGVTAQGNDPVLVRDFANMVGIKTVAYVRDLYETFDLKPLDQAMLPTSSVKPNKKLNLALGGTLGLVLGAGLAFLAEYLQAPLESVASFSILDSETGVYNGRYFRQRLGEEMMRAKRNKYPLSLALMNVDHPEVVSTSSSQVRCEALRKVAVFLKQYLREEDILARLNGTVFAFLLPDVPGEKAKTLMEKLQMEIAWTPLEMEKSGVKLNLSSATGVVAYQYNGTGQDEFLAEADRALQQAEAAGCGRVCLLAQDGEYD
jgi:diguanylate cyclase (GGDEF)-like protein